MSSNFSYALGIVGFETRRIETIMNSLNIRRFTTLKSMDNDTLMIALEGAHLGVSDFTILRALKDWYNEWMLRPKHERKTLIEDLTEDSWEEWMVLYEPKPLQEPKQEKKPAIPTTTTDMGNFKVDSRDIPKLPKNKSVQSSFADWEESFAVKMKLANVGDLLDQTYKVLAKTSDKYATYKAKDAFLQSCLITATQGTDAYPEICPRKTGRENWMKLLTSYHGASHAQNIAARAVAEFGDLQFSKNGKLTGDGFVARYKMCLRRMEENNSPFPDPLIKSDFLNKIHHPSMHAWKDVVKAAVVTNDELFTRFREKVEELSIKPKGDTTDSRLTNNQTTNGGFTEEEKKVIAKSKKEGSRMPKELWNRLSANERKVVVKARRDKLRNNKDKDGATQPQPLPMQYSGNNQGASIYQTPDGKKYQLIPIEETQPTGQHNAPPMLSLHYVSQSGTGVSNAQRASNMLSKANNLHVQISNQMKEKLSVQRYKQVNDVEGDLCVDGGTNISTMGRTFRVVQWSDRFCDMEGFANDLTKKGIRIGSGKTVVEISGEKFLIGLNEAPHLPYTQHSLLSTGQAREYGVWVGDVLKRHGGDQRVVAKGEDDNMVHLYLDAKNGLLVLPTRYPTDEEMSSLPTIWLTADSPWNPMTLDDESREILPIYDPIRKSGKCEHEKPKLEPDEEEDILQTTKHILQSVICGKQQVRMKKYDAEQYRPKLGWIPLETVRKTFEATTQLAAEVPLRYPLRRHVKARFPQLNRRRLAETFSTDTLFSSEKALGGITCAQLYCGNASMYTSIYGMTKESEGPGTLEDFIRENGAPDCIRSDNSKMQTGQKWIDVLRKFAIGSEHTEPKHPQQNPAERRIKTVKSTTRKVLDRSGAPEYLWYMCMLYVTYLLNRVAVETLGWRTPIEKCFGETPDISALMQFEFYEPIFYFDQESFPNSCEKEGYFLGIAENKGDALTYWILTEQNTVLARSVVRSAEEGEPNKRAVKMKEENPKSDLDLLSDLSGGASADIDTSDWKGMKFLMPDSRGVTTTTTVVEVDEETGKVLIEYAHGGEEWVMPNLVQEALLSQRDDGEQLWIFNKVLNHKNENGKIMLEVLWDNGDTSWEPLSTLRKDDPVTIAGYAKDNHLLEERGWKWCKRIAKREKKFLRMMKLMKAQQKGKRAIKYKFGVQIPRNVREAFELDKKNGNTKWGDAMKKEIEQLQEFESFIPIEADFDLTGYTFVPMLMCFDVKFDGRHKARYVANGSHTADPGDDIYSGVVGIDAVRIALFLGELNGLKICATDISCAFLQSKCLEKIYTRAGAEFGPQLEGRLLLMNKSVYGTKTASAAFHEFLAHELAKLGFQPSKADADLWIKDCQSHYEYIATWVDDLLIVSNDPMKIISDLERIFQLKGTGTPEYYLVADIRRVKQNKKYFLQTDAKTYI